MSGLRAATFRYPLQAVLTKRTWDVDALTQELASARHAVAAHRREAAELAARLGDMNTRLTQMRSGGEVLDLARQQLVVDYRSEQLVAHTAKELDVAKALALCEQIADQLTRARQAVTGYEDHREGLKLAHDRAVETGLAKESDDRWLGRCAAAGGNP